MPVFSRAAPRTATSTPTTVRVLQRCACGGKAGGECESCRKKQHLQRKGASPRRIDTGVAIDVSRQLTEGGAPLPSSLRESLGPLFGTNFGDVRVHNDTTSYVAAREVDARAFTLGQHIHFAAGEYRPKEQQGRDLIAHELVHTLQQSRVKADERAPVTIDPPDSALEREADEGVHRAARGEPIGGVSAGSRADATPHSRVSRARHLLQRVSVGQFFSRLFGEGTFSDKELLDYLAYLDDHGRIEDDYDSDNKARAIIRRWRAGDKLFKPTLAQKQLMLLEMVAGPTGDDDEHAILELLRGSKESEVLALLGAVGGEGALRDEFHGSESDELDAFLDAWHTRTGNIPVRFEELKGKKVRITEIVVHQDTPQYVTLRYNDGRMESNICSAGKGTCCVEPGSDAGPTADDTETNDSNWTPIGRHTVQFKQKDHSGVPWWTQFNSRGIALHQYPRIDGTPLSHGCVRLHETFAKRVFEGAIPKSTVVRVVGIPRPRCDHAPLNAEWNWDFNNASRPPEDGDDRALRRHLRIAFGRVNDEVLDRKIRERKIPRCGGGRRR